MNLGVIIERLFLEINSIHEYYLTIEPLANIGLRGDSHTIFPTGITTLVQRRNYYLKTDVLTPTGKVIAARMRESFKNCSGLSSDLLFCLATHSMLISVKMLLDQQWKKLYALRKPQLFFLLPLFCLYYVFDPANWRCYATHITFWTDVENISLIVRLNSTSLVAEKMKNIKMAHDITETVGSSRQTATVFFVTFFRDVIEEILKEYRMLAGWKCLSACWVCFQRRDRRQLGRLTKLFKFNLTDTLDLPIVVIKAFVCFWFFLHQFQWR